MQKLYAYVDENGQDTRGRIYIVAVIVLTSSERKNELMVVCEQVEQDSGKGRAKWGKSKSPRRLEYLRRVFADPRFKGNLRYAVFRNTRDYDMATIMGIAKAIHWGKPTNFTTLVFVDGLSKTKRVEYALELRKLGIPTQKVRGVLRDENNALIRLADTLAGFVRDVLDGKAPDGKGMFEAARSKGILVEV